jgi:hypothetical protein
MDWINPTATLVASFAGAWAAFKLQSMEKARDTQQANVTAINRVLTTLMQQANTLKLYQRDHINPFRDHGGRHLAIRATLPYELDTLSFDLESLSFFASKAERQIIFELSIERSSPNSPPLAFSTAASTKRKTSLQLLGSLCTTP